MMYYQETDTQVIDVQSSNPGLVSEWKRRLSNDVDIITAVIRPDSNRAGDGGLGISLEEWDRDPAHPGESVIVVQSLVPGGLAQSDGRIVPGDRLLFVNQHDLSNSSLERAVAVLKAAPLGRIRIGIAKPIPIDQCRTSSHSPIFTRSERLLARGSSPRGRRRQTPSVTTSSQETVWIGADQYRRLHPQTSQIPHSEI
ncbi:PDZ/DHR/GLGF domain protein [Necator americanus]|uniref:PDZ/DHR/GLGF domain protein n=1 Tax=Necator americanus TaxID=51031 RepID=W2T0V5_NECAM|nr:PDZ/DHR/GLGF domain protein [Necator americanus]ETN74602.1 PDZ/DHR/GLGF domain protein [Necator americanus]